MKKIICVHLLNDYSGSPIVLRNSITALLDNGYDIDLYVANAKGGVLDNVNASFFEYPYSRSNVKIFTFLSFVWGQVFLFCKIYTRYRSMKPIIYVNTMLPFGAALAGYLMGSRVIYHLHETSVSPKLLKKFLRMIIRLSSSMNIYVSKYLFHVEGFRGNIEEKVIYNSLSTSFVGEAAKGCPDNSIVDDDEFIVLMACSLKKYKGIDEYVELAKRFSCKDDRFKFILILNAGMESVDKFRSSIPEIKNLKLICRVDDMPSYYRKASIVLNLSRHKEWIETFGLTILEAMTFGVPVIGPPVGGPTEIIIDGVNGFTIDSSDLDKIEGVLSMLVDDRCLMEKLQTNSISTASRFTFKRFSEDIVNALNRR